MNTQTQNTQIYPQPMKLRFSVDEYNKLFENGILKDFEQSEIVNGELLEERQTNEKQILVIDNLVRSLTENVSENIAVKTYELIRLSDYNKVAPAVVVSDSLKTLIVIEVSESTLFYDLNAKRNLYAEAEISECWIVNLPDGLINVFQKQAFDVYQLVKSFNKGEIIQSSVLPELSISVDEILS